ncbi:MAG: HEAT repeat domain-containing protein [Planctomycetota bacterium]|jgi:HEAT repeat protein
MRGIWATALCLSLAALADSPPNIDELVSSTLPVNREKAASLLGKKGDTAAAKRLVKLLEDKDWGVRMAAIRALGPIRYAPGWDALRKQAVTGETRVLRILAARMLREHDAANATRRIAKRVTKLKKKERIPYIEALGVLATGPAVEALERQLKAPDPVHRLTAARALIGLGSGEKGLIRALKDREDAVRPLAASALAGVDTESAREALLDFLGKQTDDTDAYLYRRVGRHAAKANRPAFGAALAARIAKTKKPRPFLEVAVCGRLKECVDAARAHLKARDPLVRGFAFKVASMGESPLDWEVVKGALDHKDTRLRHAAASAFLDSAKPPLTTRLRRLIRHEQGDVALVGVRRASELRDKTVLLDLTALARGETGAKKHWHARSAACVTMGRVARMEAFGKLQALSGSRHWWLKAAAMEGLFHTYSKEVIPILIEAFDDRHPVVRMTARKNLAYMTRKKFPKKQMYLNFWKKVQHKIELAHPEDQLRQLDKYGYATRKYIQTVLKGTDIVAILGRWDKVQLVLQDLEVRHAAIRAQQIKVHGLSPKQVVLVNCEGSVDSETAEFLQWFVVTGGYMATTDWALVNALTRTFPQVVGSYTKQSTGNDVVIVEPGAPDHKTIRGVFREGVAPKWWLEIQAFPITVKDPIRATILIDSLEMLDRYGSSAMMVEFPAGLGKVLHSTSHFYLQKEGFASESSSLRRKIFAADHLGLTMKEIRELDGKGAFDNVNNTTPISRSYSMFQMLVNFIDEKRRLDLAR